MEHLICKITWQEDGWMGTFTEEDRAISTFSYIKEGGNPHERSNFDPLEDIDKGTKYGYFYFPDKTPPIIYKEGGIVFFCAGWFW